MRAPGLLHPVACVAAALFAVPASAGILDVPAEYPNVYSAFLEAAAGDTVRLAPGRYPEYELTMPGGVTLLGDPTQAAAVWFDGLNTNLTILRVPQNAARVRVEGITFRYANRGIDLATGPERHVVAQCSFRNLGAGIVSGTRIEAVQCEFDSNSATSLYGSDILVEGCTFRKGRGISVRGATVQIRDCLFESNTAAPVLATAADVQDCTFLRNTGSSGGGVQMNGGVVRNCLFRENVANKGAGVYGYGGQVVDCTFVENRALGTGGDGGAIYCHQPMTVTGCVFLRNQAAGAGGAISAHNSAHVVEHCRFLGNSATRGGAVEAWYASLTIRSCTFLRNSATTGGSLYGPATTGYTLTLQRTVIQETTAGGHIAWAAGTQTPALTYCDLFANDGGDWEGALAGQYPGTGNLSVDGRFCDDPEDSLFVSVDSPLLAVNSGQGEDIGGSAAFCHEPGILVTSVPFGIPIEVDGIPYAEPTVFTWTPGSLHTLAAPLQYTVGDTVRSDFSGWSDGGEAVHQVVAPDGYADFRASFARSFFVDVRADTGGSAEPGSGFVAEGTALTIRAVADSEWTFEGWVGTGRGSYTGPLAEAGITALGPITERGRFSFHGHYPLTMVAGPGGTVSPPSGMFRSGTLVPIRATPAAGHIFHGWTGQGNGSYTGPDAFRVIVMNGAITQHASFDNVAIVHLETIAVGPGSVTPPSGDIAGLEPVTVTAIPDAGATFDRWIGTGRGSYSGRERQVTLIPEGDITQTAYFAPPGGYPLTVTASPGGLASPPSGTYAPGDTVHLSAQPLSGYRFVEWQGTGVECYAGSDPHGVVVMHGAVTEHAIFESDLTPHGVDLSISASDTDPFVNVAAPAGAPRSLHLWLTCSQGGIAALECGLQSTMQTFAFVPAPGVFSVGTDTDLILAIDNCPTGDEAHRLLGSWFVLDTGGRLCLGPSAANGIIVTVDCGAIPNQWPDPLVRGFASDGTPPCITGHNGCSDPTPVPDVAGPGAPLPADTRLAAVAPNPFRGTTQLRLSLAASGVVRLSVYDVAGRLVRVLRDGELPAGHHVIPWNATGAVHPAGVYFVRFEAPGTRQTARVVYLGPR